MWYESSPFRAHSSTYISWSHCSVHDLQHLTYCIHTHQLDSANICNPNQWINPWEGLKEAQYGSVTFLCIPRGSFCPAWSLSATTHPPNAQTGANGHISHFQQQASEHKQLCLLPQPLVLTMATSLCLSHGSSCISSMGWDPPHHHRSWTLANKWVCGAV